MTASQLTVPPATCTVLLLADSEGERERWLQVLGELQRLLLDARPRPRPVYTLKEAYDNGLPLLPHALCAAVVGEPHAGGRWPAAVTRAAVTARSLLPWAVDPLAHMSSSPLLWAWLGGTWAGVGRLVSATFCISLSA